MVNLTQAVPYEDITAQLSQDDRIAVITCNSCVRFSGSGGVEKMEELASKLRRDGFVVTDQVILVGVCLHDHVKNLRLSEGVTAAVVLACEAGWSSVKQRLQEENVIRGTETLGLVVVDREKGVEKLMMPYRDYEDLAGTEYRLITGAKQEKHVIDMEVD
ncbi:MAG: hypothetical protein ACLFUV_07740 [Methanomassiliicoccales archaeon]